MAPKRSASAPPPVDSSEETASGSDTDESEEEIAQSPPSASTRNTAPPPQKVQQPEYSDEEEEEEEDDKANHKSRTSATQNPPPKHGESESEEEEVGETDDEAPQPEFAPKQKVEEKQPASNGDKKPAAPFQRSWSKEDEARILGALAAHRREHGKLPEPGDLETALAGRLDNRDCGRKMLMSKVKTLKTSYSRAVMKGDLPSKGPDRRIFDLSKEVWGGGGGDKPANDVLLRDLGEMSRLYPYLPDEVKALEMTKPGLFKREFGMMDDGKALALDEKLKKHKVLRIKLELRRHDLTKEVTKTLMGLLELE